MSSMSAAKHKPTKFAQRPAKKGMVYRGVHVQVPAGRSRFTLNQLKRAVEAAIVKNADALSGKI